MKKILLLEPDYKNKFPPIGLMKLANFHKSTRGDFVWFSKGKLPVALPIEVINKINNSDYYQRQYNDCGDYVAQVQDIISAGQWDRVYVTTLFTFEWERTIALIEYAKTLVDDIGKIIIGGIAATLMPDEIEKATGIKPTAGLLHDCSQIGYNDKVCIDHIIPDYSILEHVIYDYPAANSFFLTATRGCGMKCSFCAVQTLEPEYVDYIPITPRIKEIRARYGDKRDLYLLDNNVLKSPRFGSIIEDIEKAGFFKGATWINPKTGKENKRRVDFNQGLDANFFTEAKAKQLRKIALDPCHIAFDHIDDKDAYLKAAHIADEHDIRSLTSYLLYNTTSFKGKGKPKSADTPKDLYDRIYTTMTFNQEVNARRKAAGELPMYTFSFPMRFAPLGCKIRDFIGDNWNKKLLTAVSAVFQPSHGGAYSDENYFAHMYGTTYEEFYKILMMPIMYIKHKGKPAHKYPNGEQPNILWLECISMWLTQYDALDAVQKATFELTVADNEFTTERFLQLNDMYVQKLYIHYFDGLKLISLLKYLKLESPALFQQIRSFIFEDCPALISVNIELLKKHKQGENEVIELLELLFSPTFAMAG